MPRTIPLWPRRAARVTTALGVLALLVSAADFAFDPPDDGWVGLAGGWDRVADPTAMFFLAAGLLLLVADRLIRETTHPLSDDRSTTQVREGTTLRRPEVF